MKKFLLSFSVLLFGLSAVAQDVTPMTVKNVLSLKISPNGKYAAGQDKLLNATQIDLSTGDILSYDMSSPGIGNWIANDGTMVGDQQDIAIIMKDGKSTRFVRDYWFSNAYGITPDGSRICGVINNPMTSETMFIPAYFDVDENGKVSEPRFLPYPKLDFFGLAPQFITAVYISDDGKTILGQVLEWSGDKLYPIVFKQDDNNEWTYSLPSEPLFNPNHLEIPERPMDDFYVPDVYDFMSPEEWEDYVYAYQIYVENNYDPLLEPDYRDFMTEEEYTAYEAAVEKMWEDNKKYNEALKEFYIKWNEIIDSSVFFSQNAMALSPDGNSFVAAAAYEDPINEYYAEDITVPYIFDLKNNEIKKIETPYNKMIPTQIMNDGTVISSNMKVNVYSYYQVPPVSFIMLAGSDEFIPIQDYIERVAPVYLPWMEKELVHLVNIYTDPNTGQVYESDELMITGQAAVSEDFSVLVSGVYSYYFSNDSMYLTYIMDLSENAGIENISQDNSLRILNNGDIIVNGYFRNIEIYTLEGLRVFSTTNINSDYGIHTGLTPGLYVLNAIDESGKVICQKFFVK